MNHIYLDYDAVNKKQDAVQLAADMKQADLQILSEIDKIRPEEEGTDTEPCRGILITYLNSGWLQYHIKLLRNNPMITHWIVAVLWSGKQAEKDMIYRQLLSSVKDEDYYCEIIFESSDNWEVIREMANRPIKTKRSCVVISKNTGLAKEAAEILQAYLKDWTVHSVDYAQENDYSYEDAVFVVGCNRDELLLLPPQKGARKRVFWMDEPFFLESEARHSVVNEIGEMLNGLGWDIFDYQDIMHISSIGHEKALVKIYREEIIPMALKLDDEFVMWDDYGLPVPLSGMGNEDIQLFLESNSRFSKIAHQLSTKRKNNEG